MTTETASERLARLADAQGLKIDLADVDSKIRNARYDWTDGTHMFIPDTELEPLLKTIADAGVAKATVETETRVSDVNKKYLSHIPAGLLAQCNLKDWGTIPPADRIAFERNYRQTGSVNGAPSDAKAKLDRELEARAQHGLEQGRSAHITQDGKLHPDNLSALDKIKIAHATGDTSKPVTRRDYTRDQLPPVVRDERDPAKRLQLVNQVRTADVARETLATNKQLTPGERAKLETTVQRGWGGSIQVRK